MDDSLAQLVADLQERVGALGFELADVQRRGAGSRMRLQVRIDRPDTAPGRGITVDDCAQVSRALEEWLDAEQALGSRYVLEVSSPGIERPLRKARDYERQVGRQIAIRGFEPLLGKAKRIEGTLLGVEREGEERRLRLRLSDDTEIEVAMSAVAKANLVFRWEEEEPERAGSRAR